MSEIIVLGMHRSGTSLVAGILQNMGVNMGVDFLPADFWNPKGYWEDQDFLWLNKGILHNSNGSWRNPPSRKEIEIGAKKFYPKIRELLDDKQRNADATHWGWKDPRTCLTVWEFHKYLKDPKYIYVRRSPSATHASLVKLHGGKPREWMNLHNEYKSRVGEFLAEARPSLITVAYEDFIELTILESSLKQLAEFVGTEPLEMSNAFQLLNRNKTRVAK